MLPFQTPAHQIQDGLRDSGVRQWCGEKAREECDCKEAGEEDSRLSVWDCISETVSLKSAKVTFELGGKTLGLGCGGLGGVMGGGGFSGGVLVFYCISWRVS